MRTAIDELLPGSAELRELPALKPFLGLPPDTIAVVERQAGHLSPAALRDALLEQAVLAGAVVRTDPVVRVRSFTGGTGGAAKYALGAGRSAATVPLSGETPGEDLP
ncbi:MULTISPECIES: hypothetical protein [Kitasatospora]|uniref:hypothetical protein n=1 Tax=Kitasatospora TaxID=2063 RepID=UPI000C70D864|nr:hypothetical protein [Kitasatospora sp. GP30]MDH6140066.1 glycine/D-amino acid oxidase-like deaminating enzyme [Kitasatospora sp. GP30]